MCNCQCQGPTIRTQIYVFRRDRIDSDLIAEKPRYIKIQNGYSRQQSMQNKRKALIQIKELKPKQPLQIKKTENQNPNITNEKKKTMLVKCDSAVFSPAPISLQLTLRLVQEDNQFLKKEMVRLKKQERQIIKTQSIVRSKYSRQINNLMTNSEEMGQRSSQRKKDLDELKSLLEWKKKTITPPVKNSLKIPQMPCLYTQQNEKLEINNN